MSVCVIGMCGVMAFIAHGRGEYPTTFLTLTIGCMLYVVAFPRK